MTMPGLAAQMLFLVPVTPLVMALAGLLLPACRPRLLRLVWLAPVPGLLAALLLPVGASADIPAFLLGAGLVIDAPGRMLLGMTALLWLAAGLHARRTIADRPARFAGFWLVTLAGNLLVILAADVISFYLGFAGLSLAAWGMIIHSHKQEARRAATVYIRLAVIGETLLLMAMMLGAVAAGSILIEDVRQALAGSPERDLAIGLLVLGFGIKAGLMPVHVWLPLAHPAAPVPASAVLSGAIVKAGILGLLRFLPFQSELVGWGTVLAVAGFATAFLGALFGMMQGRAKTALAYSTLSQMGLVVAAMGSALMVGMDPVSLAALSLAVALYAVHHGLAKGAMFLAVDAMPGGGRWVKLAALFTALSIAGMPLSGGALAKGALKASLSGTGELLFTLSAVTTTVVLLHAWRLMLAAKPAYPNGPVAPFLLLAIAAPLLSWAAWFALGTAPPAEALSPRKLLDAAWPLAIGCLLVLLAWRAGWGWPWSMPEGDLIKGYEALGSGFRAATRRGAAPTTAEVSSG